MKNYKLTHHMELFCTGISFRIVLYEHYLRPLPLHVLFSDAISRSFLLLSQAAVCFRIHLFRYVLPSDPQTGEGCKIMQDQGEQSWAFDF